MGGGKCDPGWNDPPMFSYSSQNTQFRSSKSRTLLNKRVAFPLHESFPPSSNIMPVDPAAPLPPCNLSTLPPPPSVYNCPPKEMSFQANDNENLEVRFDASRALETTMINFSKVLCLIFEDKDKNKNDIQKRLDTMKRMWIENKLCSEIQQRLLELSEALMSGDVERADDLQKGLMVDHAPACSLWMSGVRHLIHHRPTDGELEPAS